MMRVYAISDLHGYLPQVPECELLLLGGDYAAPRDVEKQRNFFSGAFTHWLRNVPAKYIVGIAGNHDILFEKEPEFPKQLPWIYLKDALIDLEGVRIYGTPWTRAYGDWAFMLPTEDDLAGKFSGIPFKLDILLSHGPAYRCLDQTLDGTHVGSYALHNAIKEAKPDSVICGHIHEGRGIIEKEGVRYYNVTYLDHKYSPKYSVMNVILKVAE